MLYEASCILLSLGNFFGGIEMFKKALELLNDEISEAISVGDKAERLEEVVRFLEAQTSKKAMFVVSVGDCFDGLALYGPFETNSEAQDWANCNPITDLDGVAWNVVPLESTTEE